MRVESASIFFGNLCGACNWQQQEKANRLSARNIAWSFEVCTAHTVCFVFHFLCKARWVRCQRAENTGQEMPKGPVEMYLKYYKDWCYLTENTNKMPRSLDRLRNRGLAPNLRCWPSRGSREKTPAPSLIWHSDFYRSLRISVTRSDSERLGATRPAPLRWFHSEIRPRPP